MHSSDLSKFFQKKRKNLIHDADIDNIFASEEKFIANFQNDENKQNKDRQIINTKNLMCFKPEPLTRKEINIQNASNRLKRKSFSGDMKIKNQRTVFVGNISNRINKKELMKLFESCGKIESIRLRSVPVASLKLPKKALVIRKEFNPSRHNMNAYIVFEKEESCDLALKMNGFEYQGLHLRLDKVKDSKNHDTKNTIFIGNLPFDIEEEDLRLFFSDCGHIENVRVVRERSTSVGKGIAYVSFKETESVDLALTMDGTECKKRKIRIMKAAKSLKKYKKKDLSTYNQSSNSSSKNLKRKSLINKTEFNRDVRRKKFKRNFRKMDDNMSEDNGKDRKKSFKKKKYHSKQQYNSLKIANYFMDKLVK